MTTISETYQNSLRINKVKGSSLELSNNIW
jgi:hypothetical protein